MSEHQIWSQEFLLRPNPALAIELAAQNMGGMAFLFGDHDAEILYRRVSAWVSEFNIPLPEPVLQRFIDLGWLPSESRQLARTEPPGIVALTLHHGPGEVVGIVNPLLAEVTSQRDWEVPLWMPFQAKDLQNLLRQVLSEHTLGGALPERFGFRFRDRVGDFAAGPSMTIAAFLSMIGAIQPQPKEIFQAACAVLQLGENHQLEAVKDVRTKLSGFCREFDRGTLLVRPTHCPEADEFEDRFSTVWRADHLSELARRLSEEGLLAPFLEEVTLNSGEADQVIHRIHQFVGGQEYAPALELAGRLNLARLNWAVPRETRLDITRSVGTLYRHLGRYTEALETTQKVLSQLEASQHLTSYNELAFAEVEYAASLFDAHRFEELRSRMARWLVLTRDDPLRLSGECLVWIQNTVARERILHGGDWESLLRQSMKLQTQIQPADVERTRNYLIHGYLRNHQLTAAESECDAVSLDRVDPISQVFRQFLRADLARRRGEVWDCPAADQTQPGDFALQYPWGLYFQATGRQQQRDSADSRERLARASEFFRSETPGFQGQTLIDFFALLTDVARAARVDSEAAFRSALQELSNVLTAWPEQAVWNYYRSSMPNPSSNTPVEDADQLLNRCPYF